MSVQPSASSSTPADAPQVSASSSAASGVRRTAARSGPTHRRRGPSLAMRWAWGVVAALAWFGEISNLARILDRTLGPFAEEGLAEALISHFSFFTTLTNVMVAVIATVCMFGARLGPVLRWLLLTAVTGIAVTGIAHWILLRPTSNPVGFDAVLDVIQHIAVPALTVVVFVLFGPRGNIHGKALVFVLLFPLAYTAWTLWHGADTGWYPYPFIDVTELGYQQALTTAGLIFAVMVVFAFLAWGWDVLMVRLRGRS